MSSTHGPRHVRGVEPARLRQGLLCASAIALALGGAGVARAAETETGALEEVIVTARKREESLQDIPVAITAISAKQLDRYALRSIEEISASTPQLSVTRGSSGSGATISLRGIGSTFTSIGVEQSVAVIVDGVYYGQGRIINEGFFDMKQVEILKGPQALFFGKNATSGVLSFASADPGDHFEALGRVGYEFTSRTPSVEAVVSGPVSDTVGLRLAVRGARMDGGYVENLAPATSVTTTDVNTFAGTVHAVPKPQEDVPAERDLLARLTLRWTPNEAFDLTLKGSADRYRVTNATWNNEIIRCPVGGRSQVNPVEVCGGDWKIQQNDVPGDIAATNPILGRHGGQLYQDYDSYGVTGTANYSAGDVDLTSVTGFHHFVNYFLGDYDSTGTANGGTWGAERSAYRAFSGEVRAQTRFDGPLNALVGGYYQRTRLDFHQLVIFSGALEDPRARDPSLRYVTLEKLGRTEGETLAAFGQLIWKFSPQWELTAGARYTHETKDSVFNQPYVISLFQPVFAQNAPLFGDQTFENLSPEATLTWRPTGRWTVYAAYKRGFKSGGFSISALNSVIGGTTASDLAFGPEKPEGVEGGVRATLFGGAVRVSLDAFHYRYSDFQIDYFDAIKVQYITTNAGAVMTKGAEFQGEWAPPAIRGLTLRSTVAYNRARYEDFGGAPCYGGQSIAEGCVTLANGRTVQDLSGKPPAAAPKWTGAVLADYESAPMGGLVFGASANLRFSSSYLGGPFGNPGGRQRAYSVFDLALRVRSEDQRWELALIGKNLGDKYVATSVGDAPTSGSGTGTATSVRSDLIATPNPPRTVAVQFSVRY